jgi:hypothetical protein
VCVCVCVCVCMCVSVCVSVCLCARVYVCFERAHSHVVSPDILRNAVSTCPANPCVDPAKRRFVRAGGQVPPVALLRLCQHRSQVFRAQHECSRDVEESCEIVSDLPVGKIQDRRTFVRSAFEALVDTPVAREVAKPA